MNQPSNEQVVPMPGVGPGGATERLLQCASASGFVAAASLPSTFRLVRTVRPRWALVAAIVTAPLFLIGLLFLLVRQTTAGVASVFEDREGTKVRLVGLAGSGIAEALAASTGGVAVATTATSSMVSAGIAAAPSPIAPSPVARAAIAEAPSPVAAAVAASAPPPTWVAPHSLPPLLPATLSPQAAAPTGLDADRTVLRSSLIARRSTAGGAALVLNDGGRVAIGDGIVLGRAPDASTLIPSATLVPINDASLSKVHCTIGPSADGVWLVDHGSTNGTQVLGAFGAQVCTPGARIDVPFGTQVVAGEVVFQVAAS